jgi:biopolymer transport protein ExbD
MRAPSSGGSKSVSFNVTSLIDIVFLLIIFFLVASHVARSDIVEPVDLPDAFKTSDDDDQTPNRLVVTVMVDRTLRVAGSSITKDQLEQLILTSAQEQLPNRPLEIRIRADRNATYEVVEPILLACARCGVTRVGFAVMKKHSN